MFVPTLCKVDPNCKLIVPLAPSWCVEDSIETLNYNLSALETQTCNLLLSAKQFYNPFTFFVQQNSAKILKSVAWIDDNGAKIEGAATTVQMLSSQWLTPISIIYKDILDGFDESLVNTWINANFPQYTNNCINYINGQKMFVYSLKYAHILSTGATQNVTIPGYTYIYSYNVRVITRLEARYIDIPVPAKTITVPNPCVDQYIGDVIGYQYCLTNGVWSFVGLINGYTEV